MTRALVTGATGCVGANIVEALLAGGYEVRALRRPTSSLGALVGLNPEWVVGDVLNRRTLSDAMQACDLVFHAAAVSQYWRNGVGILYTTNVVGTRNVLAAARAAGVRRVVLTSSVAVLGVPQDAPRGHHRRGPGGLDAGLSEADGYGWLPDRFHYAHSKLLAEAEARRAVEAGQDVVIVNPAVVIGQRDINFVGGEILRAGRRGWLLLAPPGKLGVISARLCGVGHVLAAERGRTGERYILNGENITHRALFRLVAEVVEAPAPLGVLPRGVMRGAAVAAWAGCRLVGFSPPAALAQVDLSTREMAFNCTRARDELGLPRGSARAAVEEAWNWYCQTGLL